jgi:hypothetical protein
MEIIILEHISQLTNNINQSLIFNNIDTKLDNIEFISTNFVNNIRDRLNNKYDFIYDFCKLQNSCNIIEIY